MFTVLQLFSTLFIQLPIVVAFDPTYKPTAVPTPISTPPPSFLPGAITTGYFVYGAIYDKSDVTCSLSPANPPRILPLGECIFSGLGYYSSIYTADSGGNVYETRYSGNACSGKTVSGYFNNKLKTIACSCDEYYCLQRCKKQLQALLSRVHCSSVKLLPLLLLLLSLRYVPWAKQKPSLRWPRWCCFGRRPRCVRAYEQHTVARFLCPRWHLLTFTSPSQCICLLLLSVSEQGPLSSRCSTT